MDCNYTFVHNLNGCVTKGEISSVSFGFWNTSPRTSNITLYDKRNT